MAGLRNPPEFNGYWQQPGFMRIQTGVQALSAVLQVKIDGQVMFEQTVQSNTEYLNVIPPGFHQVVFDNRGQGFFSVLEINKITFENYAPALRAFALKGQNRALVWVHNRFSNWQVAGTGSVPTISGTVRFPGLQGSFVVSYCNTSSGDVDSVMQLVSGADGLIVNIPSLDDDLALRVEPAPTRVEPHFALNVKVFPNPFHATVRFEIPSAFKSDVFRLEITDITGRLAHSQDRGIAMPEGFVWDGTTSDGYMVSPGIYIFRLLSFTGRVISGKFVRW